MFKIVGRLRCPICSGVFKIDDKVFLDDILNAVVHQKCYYQSPKPLLIKDEGPFKKMLMKYPFFNEDEEDDSV